MNPDVVVIPCFDRPEFVVCCVERLLKCPEAKDVRMLFAIDDHDELHPHAELDAAIGQVSRAQDVVLRKARTPWRGNSANVLGALKMAATFAGEFVFLVEDDVIVADDFLRWSYAVHRKTDLFASVAVRNTNDGAAQNLPDDAEAFYLSTRDYSSLGVCLPLSSVDEIVKHAVPEYLSNPVGYCAAMFPQSRLNRIHSEQDGLIRRIIERDSRTVAWPCRPRAAHIGFVGYNRAGQHLKGSLKERCAKLRSMLGDKAALNSFADPAWSDIEPCALTGNEWSDVYCLL